MNEKYKKETKNKKKLVNQSVNITIIIVTKRNKLKMVLFMKKD